MIGTLFQAIQELKVVARLMVRSIIFVMKALFSLRYSVKAKGLEKICSENFSSKKGTLFLPAHPSYLDAPLVVMTLWKKFQPRPLALETYYYMPLFNSLMKLFRALPVPNFYTSGNAIKKKRWEKIFDQMLELISKGEDLLIYPSGKVKLTSVEALGATSTVYDILQHHPDVNIVLVRIEGMWGSRFSKALRPTAPDFIAEFYFALKMLAKNLFFFAPRRKVTLTYEIAGEYFPRKGSKLDINRYLERWYNQSLDTEKISGETLQLVSYSALKKQLPALYEAEEQKSIDKSSIPEEIKEEIKAFLAQLTGKKAQDIQFDQELAQDLGLDSLDAAQIITHLQETYHKKRIYPQQLTTVGVVMGLASGLICEESDEELQEDVEGISLKLWNQLAVRKVARIPQGRTVPEVFFNSCSRMKGAACLVDATSGVLSYKEVKTRIILLARHFQTLQGERVGLLLPSTGITYMCILALMLAGKVPVMINWTTGKKHLQHVIRQSGVQQVISSWKFIDRLEGTELEGLEEKLILLEDLKPHFTLLSKLKAYVDSFKATKSLLRDFEIEDVPPTSPCVILYTSGTENLPKGVPLSHYNVLSNLRAATALFHLTPDDALLAYLPPFHSFGFSVTGLLPLLIGIRVAYSPDPTDSQTLVSLITRFRLSLVCGAPTFLKGILQAGSNESFSDVRLFVSGAEKASLEILQRVEQMPWTEFVEGYGITECSPIISFNEPGMEKKGVGRPVSGVEILIVHPETLQAQDKGKEGLILTRGPNVFSGYLEENLETPFVEVMGKLWYKTGDLGYLDNEGHLYISGRLKRFVKVGGEMISLASLEQALYEAAHKKQWSLAEEGPSLAVIAREEAGEKSRFYLFSSFSITLEEANHALKDGGISNLAKFSHVHQVKEIPVMGTGKVHYRKLQSLLTQ